MFFGGAGCVFAGGPRSGEGTVAVRGGELRHRGLRVRCAVGRGGIRWDKREGDGATPAGRFALTEVLYRSDRGARPQTLLPVRALSAQDGWCDGPGDEQYNRLVALPYAGHHEELWRADGVYDLLAVIGFNDSPPVPGRGSAIFLHVASPGWGATDGCVAIELRALRTVLAGCGPGTMIDIGLAG